MPHVPTAPNLQHSASRETHDMLKKIPKGAEATTVLVGSTDFLEKPIMAFLRYKSLVYRVLIFGSLSWNRGKF